MSCRRLVRNCVFNFLLLQSSYLLASRPHLLFAPSSANLFMLQWTIDASLQLLSLCCVPAITSFIMDPKQICPSASSGAYFSTSVGAKLWDVTSPSITFIHSFIHSFQVVSLLVPHFRNVMNITRHLQMLLHWLQVTFGLGKSSPGILEIWSFWFLEDFSDPLSSGGLHFSTVVPEDSVLCVRLTNSTRSAT